MRESMLKMQLFVWATASDLHPASLAERRSLLAAAAFELSYGRNACCVAATAFRSDYVLASVADRDYGPFLGCN